MKKQETITFYGVWLGFIRKSNNRFYWIDDTPLLGHYSLWGSGEPNNATKNEYCSSMFGQGGGAGEWNDLWCTLKESQLKYAPSILCQKKANWTNDAAIFSTLPLNYIYQNQTFLAGLKGISLLGLLGRFLEAGHPFGSGHVIFLFELLCNFVIKSGAWLQIVSRFDYFPI